MPIARLAVIALAVVALRGSADAAPIFYSSAYAGVTVFPSGQSTSDNQLVYSVDTLGPATASLADGSAWASVTDGALRAYATTGGTSAATAVASFSDTLLLSSDSLASGTAVQLAVELLFTSTLSSNGVTSPCSSYALASADLIGGGNAGQIGITDGSCDLSDYSNPSGLFTGYIGQELILTASLRTAVAPFGGAYTADAGHTLRFLATPVGDFTYTTASGNSYLAAVPDPTPVPEPSTLMLLGSALSIAGAKARKRLWKA